MHNDLAKNKKIDLHDIDTGIVRISLQVPELPVLTFEILEGGLLRSGPTIVSIENSDT
jgi:hypothetical protein